MKKILTILLTLCMLATLLPVGILATENTAVACAYIYNYDTELYEQEYFGTFKEAIEASQNEDANGHVYVKENCDI